jgi:hypothetical protein
MSQGGDDGQQADMSDDADDEASLVAPAATIARKQRSRQMLDEASASQRTGVPGVLRQEIILAGRNKRAWAPEPNELQANRDVTAMAVNDLQSQSAHQSEEPFF